MSGVAGSAVAVGTRVAPVGTALDGTVLGDAALSDTKLSDTALSDTVPDNVAYAGVATAAPGGGHGESRYRRTGSGRDVHVATSEDGA